MKVVTKSIEIAGRTLSFEVGKLAQQATASVLAKYGEATVLATVVVGAEDTKKDYFPLQVEYLERLYSGGRIKGSRWVKRERGTDAETLSARLIDRSIRPLFPESFKNEVQVVIMVLSSDSTNDTDVLGINAVSAALAISPIPWNGPVAAVRMGLKDGKSEVNPSNGNESGVDLDLVVTSTESLIPMIEAGANQVPEDQVMDALKTGVAENKKIVETIKSLVSEVGIEKLKVKLAEPNSELVAEIARKAQSMIDEYLESASKKEGNSLNSIITAVSSSYEEKDKISQVPSIIEHLVKKTVRKNLLEKEKRCDGRKVDEIRALSVEVGVLPRVHGSAVFQRGQTQALTVTTLGAPSLAQTLESAEGEESKRYMHHYNFPPFSTGEIKRMGGPGRREIGHGALAERALTPVIPSEQEFPYAIRVVSEILSSNGSSSMASTCGSTLSLMDAGVPLKAPVAGISTGLVQEGDKYLLITDIIGLEDHYTDMDFKVAGTKDGITAIQLDTKIPGLTLEIIEVTLARAKTARMQIMEKMLAVLPTHRTQLSQYAPKIVTSKIPVDKIGELIGPGGKHIKKLMADTETDVEVNDDGSVFITGVNPDGVQRALAYVSALGREVKQGEVFEGTVVSIQPFGAFVNILPGKDGLLHVSQMAEGFVSDPNQLVQIGQTLRVWVTETTPEGKIGLSKLFDATGNPIVKAREERAPRPPMGGRGGFDRRDNGGRNDRFQAPRRRF